MGDCWRNKGEGARWGDDEGSSSHPQGEAGDPGAHWQTVLTDTQRGEYLLAGTVSKQSITLTTASLHQTEKKVMGTATETLTNKKKKSH